ncbi:MAG TPA: carboxypeptidase-like regulatory domain-containing protein [Ferruginibacter sp.]|nr:carboxypeptidase-like regulatory domain-containing protein [Ferruginibacter sp.]HRO16646.1 carboxypeptidase-like regulatory domain-containing protein [Ferruginibacter sp.]HRQ21223.1 carboxypeptidase-like regulatory domain-containing protein [Ferruginibacter sp.]
MAVQTKSWKLLASSLLLLFITFYSCKKSDNVGGETAPDLVSRVSASANGYVTNESNQPVQGATVKMGLSTTTTDAYGYFEINNAQVVKNAAVITVQQPGYFKAIKTFAVESGRKHTTRIQLIPRVVIGTIDAATGGTATDANGMKVELPAAGVVNATTGAAYTGSVQVAAHWIDPSSPELSATMPGDLRALNNEGLMRTLITYGMIKVELTGSGGEPLQIATGKKSKLTFQLPASMSGSAPASIPLWFFDEDKGLWIEEGSAMRVGNTYEGEVSHFSYWNCDVPANFVHFNVTVIDAYGNPIPMAHVRIRSQSNPYNTGVGYTDSTGYTSGYIPANSDLVIEISYFNSCGTPSYTQNFSTTNANLSLGIITLPAAAVATASGTLTDCNGQPVTSGAVVVQYSGGPVFRYPVDATGAFQFSTPLCGANAVINIIGVDATSQQQSNGMPYTLVSGTNNIGNIQACGVTTTQFVNFTINGTSYAFTAPVDSVYMSGQGTQIATIGAFQINGNNWMNMGVGWMNIALNAQQPMYYFHTNHLPDSTSNPSQNIWVTITELGNVGEFVAGEFSGTFIGPPPNNTPYAITCTFRVRRLF